MVARLIWNAVSGGTKLLVKSYWAVRRAKGRVKKSKKDFCRILTQAGLPKEAAERLADTYAAPGLEVLSVRKMIELAREFD
ncbi:hypothetical protein EU538_06630 [Candidatus Thorarchaeota archaeon]|nr:MAG: hypothetical protein EU538_06630 [Candidatus Thorarchaeota archaeon]